ITPFALDTRDERRWIGFVSKRRVRPRTFETAFSALLQAAVSELGLMPAEWEVDLIPRAETLREWIEEHPDVAELERVVRSPNPSRRFDDDRQAMRDLGAVEKDERYKPPRNQRLDLESEIFQEFEEDATEGYVDLTVHSRSGRGTRVKFSTTQEKAIESY